MVFFWILPGTTATFFIGILQLHFFTPAINSAKHILAEHFPYLKLTNGFGIVALKRIQNICFESQLQHLSVTNHLEVVNYDFGLPVSMETLLVLTNGDAQ